MAKETGLKKISPIDDLVSLRERIDLPEDVLKIIQEGTRAYEKRERYLQKLSIKDALTGLYNQRHFNDSLEKEISRSNRHKCPLSLIMLDIDNFKKYNDTYGHLEGNKVLKGVSVAIKNSIREIDSAYRYGGEEFTVILPETIANDAVILAERVRKSIENQKFSHKKEELNVTASFGVTQYQIKERIEDFVGKADKNMYNAKDLGKNRVCSAEI